MRVRSEAHGIVCGWPVERRHRDIVEPKIDTQLGAVMNQVVEEHTAIGRGARHVSNQLIAEGELPVFLKMLIAGGGKICPGLGSECIELGEQLLARLEDQRWPLAGG